MTQSASHNPSPGTGRRLRVLQVLFSLNLGGIETWLVQLLQHLDRDAIDMHVLLHTDERGQYGDALQAMGVPVHFGPPPSHAPGYARRFAHLLREHGPYDAVHCHTAYWSGQVLRLAHRHGVPCRVVHSRNDYSHDNARAGVPQRLYRQWMMRRIHRHATLELAITGQAGRTFYGEGWADDPRARVVPSAIALEPFRQPVDRAALRRSLGLAETAIVVGHVGRFVAQKNHALIVEAFAALASREPGAVLLLVGDGPLRGAVEAAVRRHGLDDRVRLLGRRADVVELLRGVFDVLLFPSLFEGQGRVVIEAQAAGLAVVMSEAVPAETRVVASLVERLTLDAPAAQWAEAAARCGRRGAAVDAGAALARVEASDFNMARSAERLAAIYGEAARGE
ncbi:MAG: glycosyltransferase [Phycisphaeraceae bacterium]